MGKPIKQFSTTSLSNMQELHSYMRELSRDNNYAWCADVVFGEVYIRAYRVPSDMTYHEVGDSSFKSSGKDITEHYGYYRRGKLHEFSDSLVIRYQRAGQTRDNPPRSNPMSSDHEIEILFHAVDYEVSEAETYADRGDEVKAAWMLGWAQCRLSKIEELMETRQDRADHDTYFRAVAKLLAEIGIDI